VAVSTSRSRPPSHCHWDWARTGRGWRGLYRRERGRRGAVVSDSRLFRGSAVSRPRRHGSRLINPSGLRTARALPYSSRHARGRGQGGHGCPRLRCGWCGWEEGSFCGVISWECVLQHGYVVQDVVLRSAKMIRAWTAACLPDALRWSHRLRVARFDGSASRPACPAQGRGRVSPFRWPTAGRAGLVRGVRPG
jgi:hypothetical protein